MDTFFVSTGHFWPVVKILFKIDYVARIGRFLSHSVVERTADDLSKTMEDDEVLLLNRPES